MWGIAPRYQLGLLGLLISAMAVALAWSFMPHTGFAVLMSFLGVCLSAMVLLGLTAPRPNLHMCFTGEPGTGKTTMALQMGDLLHRLGYLTLQMQQPRFANARSVRNELEQARLRHAHRLASDPDMNWSKDDLMRIEPLDIFPNAAFAVPALEVVPALEEPGRQGDVLGRRP
jgi:hypothetical protein